MAFSARNALLISALGCLLAACGGGGGSGDSSPVSGNPTAGYPAALEFETPDTFLNGSAFATEATVTEITGGLNSVFIPRGECPGNPSSNYSIRWSNLATGDSGSAPIGIGCVSVPGGLSGVRSLFTVSSIRLVLGLNIINFDTFDGIDQIGNDRIRIVVEDNTAPILISRYPKDGQIDVPPNHALVAVFNEPMVAATLNNAAFRIEDMSGAEVSGQISSDSAGTIWQFTPDAALAANSSFRATISADVEDSGGNNALGTEFTWTFATASDLDVIPPAIATRWPGAGCDCAPLTTRIMAGFSEYADAASLDPGVMTVSSAAGAIAGNALFRGNYIEFVPDEPLSAGETYRVSIAPGVRDLAGLVMATGDSWEFAPDSSMPVGEWIPTNPLSAPGAASGATAVSTGSEIIIWGGGASGRYDFDSDFWFSPNPENEPAFRTRHSAVWTGAEMIVWGGGAFVDGEFVAIGDGAAYALAADQWSGIVAPGSTEAFATFDHAAVWTGTEMIVWGGTTTNGGAEQVIDTGWRYPSFATISTVDAPSPRARPDIVWTGTEMIVWGGFDGEGQPLNDGARYDPLTDTWLALPSAGERIVPSIAFSAVWTGTEMIVWNGGKTVTGQVINDRLRVPTLRFYDPATDTWRESNSGWEPFIAFEDPLIFSLAAGGYFAEWIGDRMFVAGRYLVPGLNFLYDPVTDRWQRAADATGLYRRGAAASQAGSGFLHWGGVENVLSTNSGMVFRP